MIFTIKEKVTDNNVEKVLFYCPFEGLSDDEIDALNTKMRGMYLYSMMPKYVEIDTDETCIDCDENMNPMYYYLITTMANIPKCDRVITINSNKPSPTQEVIINMCKAHSIPVYVVSNDGKSGTDNDTMTGIDLY